MKSILLLFLALTSAMAIYTLAPAMAIHAQQSPVDQLSQAMTDSLSYLQLTDKQKQQAVGLNKTAATSLLKLAQKAKQDTTLKGSALAKQVMGIMKTRNTGLSALLVPDQQKLFQQHKIEQLADLQTKMMTTQLDLTTQQVPQVYQINLKSTGEMMADMQKLQNAGGKLKKMKAAKGLKSDTQDTDAAFKQILSASQYNIYEKNKEAMQSAMKEKMREQKNNG